MSSPPRPAADIELLKNLVVTPLNESIPTALAAKALSSQPFVELPGAFNLRDCGAFYPGYLAPGKVYRSGMLDFMTPESRQALNTKLGIRKIYDFRRNDEKKSATPNMPETIEIVPLPYKDGKESPKPLDLAEYVTKEDGTPGVGYPKMHEDILDGYVTGYKRVFEGLRDSEEDEAVLYHCSGGKDRTGVLSAIILDFMGVPADIIGIEYALTRVGSEPFRLQFMPLALKSMGLENTSSGDMPGGEGFPPGTWEFFSTDAPVMVGFVRTLHEKYGGAEGYLKNELGFNDADIQLIRQKLSPRIE